MSKITMQQAREWYRTGNNDGRGFEPPTVVDEDAVSYGEGTIDSAVARAVADGWTVLLHKQTSDDVVLLRNDAGDGALVAIGGNAVGDDAWAVDVTRYAAAAPPA